MLLWCLKQHIVYLDCWAESRKRRELVIHGSLQMHCHIPANANLISHFCSAERKLRHCAIMCLNRKETEALCNHVICLRYHSKVLSKTGEKYRSMGSCCFTSTFEHGKTSLLHDLKAGFSRNSYVQDCWDQHPTGAKFWVTEEWKSLRQ